MIDGVVFLNMCTVQYFIIQHSITELHAFLYGVLSFGHKNIWTSCQPRCAFVLDVQEQNLQKERTVFMD